MPKSFKSTKNKPLRFFINYPVGGRDFLYKDFKKINSPYEYFDLNENKAFRFLNKRDAEGLTSTIRVEYPFEQYIYDRFDDEVLESQRLISLFYKKNKSKDENEFAYTKLMRAFIENFKKAKNVTSYPEAELLPSALIEIANHAIRLYRKLFNLSIERAAKSIIEKEEKRIGQTGYKLKKEYKNRIPTFHANLISGSLIAKETEIEHWYKIFNGRYPTEKINWIGEYKHLRYFISLMESSP